MQFTKLDVRPLIKKGVEPFSLIRERVDELKPGKGIVVLAPFLPSPLIEKLRSEGFDTRLEKGAGSDWLVYFWREETNK